MTKLQDEELREILAEETVRFCTRYKGSVDTKGNALSCNWPRCGCNVDERAAYEAMRRVHSLSQAPLGEEDRATAREEVPDLDGWEKVGPGTPLNALLETKKAGEEGQNVCFGRVISIGDDVEWVEHRTGVTTVTHHSFAAPDYWRWPAQPVAEATERQGWSLVQDLRDVAEGLLQLAGRDLARVTHAEMVGEVIRDAITAIEKLDTEWRVYQAIAGAALGGTNIVDKIAAENPPTGWNCTDAWKAAFAKHRANMDATIDACLAPSRERIAQLESLLKPLSEPEGHTVDIWRAVTATMPNPKDRA